MTIPVQEPLERVYRRRFSEEDAARKDEIWRKIVRYLQRFVGEEAAVIDVACDRGHFIRHIVAREKWAADVRDVSRFLPSDVRFVQSDGVALAEHAPAEYFDVAFMSNYLEHLDSGAHVVEQLRTVRQLLKPGGCLIVLQPNTRLIGDAYWEFIDHKVPLTEKSLSVAAELTGFRTRTLITRFLPYTTKSRIPQHPLLVRTYLACRPGWLVFGEQTLYVRESPGPARNEGVGRGAAPRVHS